MKPRLLDLFCGAGGCSMGYHRAGFDVVGVDMNPQKSYPFKFLRDDAIDTLRQLNAGLSVGPFVPGGERFNLKDLAVIHASPPCQRYTVARTIHSSGNNHPDLIGVTRNLLERSGRLWIMENVPNSPMGCGVVLCGLMFGLRVIRHRVFESNIILLAPAHGKHPVHLSTGTVTDKRGGKGNGYSTGEHGLVCAAGNNFVREAGASAMGVEWMKTRKEIANAIPPAYTEYLGKQLLAVLERTNA